MNIIKSELYKLITAPAFVFLTLGLLFVNIYLSLIAEPVTVSDEEYRTYYENMEKLKTEECVSAAEKLINSFSFENFNHDDYMKYSFYRTQLEQLNNIINYKEYLANIDSAVDKMSSVSIFSKNENSFTYRNIQKTQPAYDPVREVTPVFSPSEGVLLALDSKGTDVFLIFLTLAAVTILIGKEREIGIIGLLKPLIHYKNRLALSKIIVLFIVCVAGGIILYGSSLFIGNARFGLGDISRPVQSLKGFLECNLPISVLQLLSFAFTIKIFTAFFAALIFQCLITKLSNNLAYGVFIAVSVLEIVAYANIDLVSIFSVFGRINVAAFMNSGELFSTYQNLNIFNIPINLLTLTVITLIFGICVFTFLSIILFSNMSIAVSKNLKLNLPAFIFGYNFRRRFSYALYKTFITHKGAAIIFAVLLIQIYGMYIDHKDYSVDDVYYHKYCDELANLSDDEAEEYITKETEYFNMLIGNEVNGRIGFDKAVEQYRYISALDSENKSMFYLTGWNKLFGVESYTNDLSPALIALLAICLAISPLIAYDNRFRMGYLLFATKSGYKCYLTHCILSSAIATSMISAATYIPNFLSICNLYGTDGIFYSIRCIPEWNAFFDVPIIVWLITLFLLRTMVLLLNLMIILCISSFYKNVYAAELIALAIFTIPIAIYLIGIEFALTICSPVSINREILEGRWWYWVALIILATYSVFKLYHMRKNF